MSLYTPTTKNITLYQAVDNEITFIITDSSTGNVIDLTDLTPKMIGKTAVGSPVVYIDTVNGIGALTVTDAVNGVVVFTLSVAESTDIPESLTYDIKVVDLLIKTHIFVIGTINIIRTVTR